MTVGIDELGLCCVTWLTYPRTAVTVSQAYGLTETSPGTHVVPPEWALVKAGTVGRLQPNMQARLVDDHEQDVAPGSPGELWVRGPNVMKGYLNNPVATNNTITADGWLKVSLIVPQFHSLQASRVYCSDRRYCCHRR